MLANPDIGVTQIAHRLGVSPATLYRYGQTLDAQLVDFDGGERKSFFARAGVTESTVIETVLDLGWSGLDWVKVIATALDRVKVDTASQL